MKVSKKAKKELVDRRISNDGRRMSDKFNQIVLDNVPVSVITLDKKGYITSANKYFEYFSRIKDYSNHNIFKDKFFLKDHLAEDYKKLLKDGTIVQRDHFYEKDSQGPGEDRYFKIRAVPFRNQNGEIEGVVSLALDNTEATESKAKLLGLNNSLEKKVEQRTRELDKLNKELKKVIELKSIFMADVSHEFRTSLTIIQCSMELLSKSCCADKEDTELFKNVIIEVERVSSMLSNLSLLTKTDSPNLKLYFKKINLTSLINPIFKELKVVASEKKISIEFQDNNTPAEIMGNEDDIEKLVLNLIRNAIKYNKENGWIKVSLEKANKGVFLKVEDGGIGIPENEFSNIFERFYRVDKARTRDTHDSGLGLAICKHVAEMHGGDISVFSKLGQGSLFTVYLPYNPK